MSNGQRAIHFVIDFVGYLGILYVALQWLHYDSEIAGNLFRFWVWTIFVMSLVYLAAFILSTEPRKPVIKSPAGFVICWIVHVFTIVVVVGAGETLLGAAMLASGLIRYGAREANRDAWDKLESKREALRRAMPK